MGAIEKFLFHCEFEKRLSKKTIKAYTSDLKQFSDFIKVGCGVDDVLEVGKNELKKYVRFVSAFKPKTTKRKIATAKAMFNFFEFEELIPSNPFRKVMIRIKEPMLLPRVMNMMEVNLLFSIAYKELKNASYDKDMYLYREKLRDVAVMELLFGTGIRVSELCSLKYCDIGVDFSSIRVYGKGSKERSIQIMNHDIKKALEEYYGVFMPDIRRAGFFFINRLGNRLSEQSVRLMIRKYRNECNITKNITPHMFRHTFATLLLEQDVDIKYIQNLLGHSSIMTTQIYTHVSSEKQSEILKDKNPRNGLKLIS